MPTLRELAELENWTAADQAELRLQLRQALGLAPLGKPSPGMARLAVQIGGANHETAEAVLADLPSQMVELHLNREKGHYHSCLACHANWPMGSVHPISTCVVGRAMRRR